MNVHASTIAAQVIRSLAAGSILLPGIVTQLLADEDVPARGVDPLAPGAAFHAAGQARDLPVHDRRRVAYGHVRPEAEAR